jgi:hypothetical protein
LWYNVTSERIPSKYPKLTRGGKMVGYLVGENLMGHGQDQAGWDENEYGFGGDGWGSGYNEPGCFDFHGGGPSLDDGEEDGFGTGGGGWEEARYSEDGEGFGCGYGSPGGSEDWKLELERGSMGDQSYRDLSYFERSK